MHEIEVGWDLVTVEWLTLDYALREDARTTARVVSGDVATAREDTAKTWEVSSFDAEADPDRPEWEPYSDRRYGLSRWIEAADEALDAARRAVTNRMMELKMGLRKAARDIRKRERSRWWRSFVGALVLLAVENIDRMLGCDDEDDIAKVLRIKKRTPFSGTNEVLASARSEALLGVGKLSFAQRPQVMKAGRGPWMEAKDTFSGASSPKALGAVEHRVDAAWALGRAMRGEGLDGDRLSREDLALLAAGDVGVVGKARRLAHGVEEAFRKATPRELAARVGKSEKVTRARVRRVRRFLGEVLEQPSRPDSSGVVWDGPLAPPPRRRRARVEEGVESSAAPRQTREPSFDPFAGAGAS